MPNRPFPYDEVDLSRILQGLRAKGAKKREIAAAITQFERDRNISFARLDEPQEPKRKKKPLKGLDLESLEEWNDQQPWYVKIPMGFALLQLTIFRLIIVMFGFGLLFYFLNGAGAP